ncbi:MAG: UPF0721 transmembrane protein [Alphaproteobacteria bacterium]|nr:MAG: UPF0721 transmembrane protein [Alphaproteobacteria bacterium]
MIEFLQYAAIGVLAQLVDGALGMAYGVLSTSFLLGAGLPPAAASASVHAAEVVTTGLSGLSHAYFRNIDRRLFVRLAPAGVAGGVVGAYLLSSVPGDAMRPFVAVYLGIMGVVILRRAVNWGTALDGKDKPVVPLGFVGGLLDALGGGWGPIVVSTLIGRGGAPRYSIGTVVAAEFFVTFATSLTFIVTIGLQHWEAVLGLLAGGAIAAPFAGWLGRHLPPRPFTYAVGVAVVLLAGWNVGVLFWR